MLARKYAKYWLFGSRGFIPYFGTKIYFPPDSGAFKALCAQGIYEIDNTRVLTALTRAGTTCFDIGANIGLMTAELLAEPGDRRVVSFEPSPSVAPFLRRTVAASGMGDRWRLVEKAMGVQSGSADFVVTKGTGGLYDGLKDTQRAAENAAARVEISTLDLEWDRLGRPEVSMVKIDVEGAEIDVLNGGKEFLRAQRPAVLLEWTEKNLSAYHRQPAELLTFAAGQDYRVFTVPFFTPVDSARVLELHMSHTESFLLVPAGH